MENKLEEIESILKQRETKLDEAFELLKVAQNKIIELERATYNGMTYSEYINTLQEVKNIDNNITIKINQYNVFGSYKISDDISITAYCTIYGHDTVGMRKTQVEYLNKTLNEIPKKYEKEFNKLKDEMFKCRIKNISADLREKYQMTYF